MRIITDAGLVPGRKQNTMGIETGLIQICKICRFRQDTTINRHTIQPENRIQNNKFEWTNKLIVAIIQSFISYFRGLNDSS